MTLEKRVVVPVGDIRAVILTCKDCQTRIHWPADNAEMKLESVEQCPGCHKPWWKSAIVKTSLDSTHVFMGLIQALRMVREAKTAETVGFTMAFEIEQL